MIKLEKLPKPTVLQDFEVAWTAEYLVYKAGGPAPAAAATRYRHADIKLALRSETNDKCAYCESTVTQVYPGDTEHILPKSVRPDLIVEWTNLAFVCAQCNREKADYFSDVDPLINPYVDRPEQHLRFIGPLCLEVPGDRMGMTAVLRLKLGRPALIERRKERLEYLQSLLNVWAMMGDGPTKETVAAVIRDEAGRHKPYSAAAIEFLRFWGWDV
jgi:uncharacterized protein (TIGR02646 family)